ncbi:hypothetical protein [Solicola sp. PLA-1-18]|uniref:hypothetical protein n=1 Tax=Solicola sp. PLA-1-18 TaxID=3380532 RepID=UPI003B7F0C00
MVVFFRPTRFKQQTPNEIELALAPFNVFVDPLDLPCYYHWDEDEQEMFKEIGDVVVYDDGLTKVRPRQRVSDRQMRALFGAAELALHTKPCAKDGWQYKRKQGGRSYWASSILIAIDLDNPDEFGMWVRRDAERTQARDERLAAQAHETRRPTGVQA